MSTSPDALQSRSMRSMRDVALRVMSGAAAGRLLTLVAILVAARILGPNNFGVFALAMSSSQLLGMVTTVGMARGAIRLLPRHEANPDRQSAVIARSLQVSVAVLLILWAVLSVLPSEIAEAWMPGVNSVMLIGVCLWTAGFACSNYVRSLLTGLHRQGQAALWILIRSILFAAVLLIGSATVSIPWMVLLCGAVEAGSALAALLVVIVTHRAQTRTSAPRASGRLGRELWSNGLPGWLADVSVQATLWFLIFSLTNSPGGAAAAGVFAVGQRAFVMVTMLPRQAALSFVPFLVRARDRTGLWHSTVIRTLRWVTGLAVTIAIMGSLVLLLSRGFLGEYADHGWALQTMCLIGVLGASNSAMGVIAQAAGNLGSWAASDATASLVTVAIAVVALDELGVWGAILAFGAGQVVRSLILLNGRGWRVAT